jgi:hypothetical protein
MGSGLFSEIVHWFHRLAKPDLETIRNSLHVSVVQRWLAEMLATSASLVPDDRVIPFATVKAYSEGDQIARPPILTARHVGAGEATHDVRIVKLDAVVEATSFEKLHREHWVKQLRHIIM